MSWIALAKGGVVGRATPALIGEDGPEAVVPLKNNTGWINMIAEKLLQYFNSGFGASGLAQIPAALNNIANAIPKIDVPAPVMASGTVLPPNLRITSRDVDDLRGAIDALRDVLQRNPNGQGGGGRGGNVTYRFDAQINRRTLFDEMITEAKLRRDSNGRNPFALG